MLHASFWPGFAMLAFAGLLSAAACSVTPSWPNGFDSLALPEPDASSGSGGSSGPGSSGSLDASTSCADPTCPRYLCDCNDDTAAATTDVCRSGGTCDLPTACRAACGGAEFSGSATVQKVCSPSAVECASSFPSISCACKQGPGWNADAVCKEGYCSSARQDVCSAACASDGGWAGCKMSSDCAPLICACKDGAKPVTGALCLAVGGGTCGPASGQCPSLCSTHGGWSGDGSGGGADAGSAGPKKPGEACNKASECTPFDCTCNNGDMIKNSKSCQGNQCSTRAENCGFVCMGAGGWSGK